MDQKFIDACDFEIEDNVRKGEWETSNMDVRTLSLEIGWHITKLNNALLAGNIQRIKEYACDVANYCDKAYSQAENLIPYKEKPIKEEIEFIQNKSTYGDGFSSDSY